MSAMKFVLASYGTRGDVEPCVAVGRELLRRGHEVRMAVSPDMVGFAESAGLAAVAYGPDPRRWQGMHHDFLRRLFRNFWKVQDLIRLGRQDWELFAPDLARHPRTQRIQDRATGLRVQHRSHADRP
jgi:UDP:flavonoid glycosyltransferase YjiC (YdhE family)